MEFNLEIGMKATKTQVVHHQHTAKSYGSGLLEVFATPAMIALMEGTALEVVQQHLPHGYGTVGMSVNIKHLAATPLQMMVTCEAELIEIDGKKLTFKVTAKDEKDLIGEGIHERYIIDEAKFLQRVESK